jgi:hypothetical protein
MQGLHITHEWRLKYSSKQTQCYIDKKVALDITFRLQSTGRIMSVLLVHMPNKLSYNFSFVIRITVTDATTDNETRHTPCFGREFQMNYIRQLRGDIWLGQGLCTQLTKKIKFQGNAERLFQFCVLNFKLQL